MRIGLTVSRFTWPGGPEKLAETFSDIARDADEGGIAGLWVMDHFFQIGLNGLPELEMPEAYSLLAYAAAVTRRITLGTLVTGVTHRRPAVLVKTVTTLDVLSGGRAWLGVGAGWFEEEARGLGLPFPALKERFAELEDTLRIAHHMWSGDTGPYRSDRHHLERPLNSPAPLSRPHPRILVGGGGERRTLPLVARYADACNLPDGPDLPDKLRLLRELCEKEGRDFGSLTKSVLSRLPVSGEDGSVERAVRRCAELAAQGAEYVVTSLPDVHDPAARARLAEVAARVADL
ncbi:TIGR03560 family F420-dependent LLM class oxidoreductase [Streptomyces misionensis]|uniref:TIGR03560 family F420-dependent LLM class oxidoreductase n=1 Tax=Streptomyces misionensis TaxID=67331 RepID=UPI0036FE73B4